MLKSSERLIISAKRRAGILGIAVALLFTVAFGAHATNPVTINAPRAPAHINNITPSGAGVGLGPNVHTIGALGGDFRVNESGGVTYSVPIGVPAGRADVTPIVGLTYQSGAGNGLLGVGWSLTGMEAIVRCRQTLGQDLVTKPIKFSASDRFCYNGQRLLPRTGENGGKTSTVYGAVGAEYETEVNGVDRIVSVGGSLGRPDYFKVYKKDGSVTYFGKDAAARKTGKVLHTTPPKIGLEHQLCPRCGRQHHRLRV